MSIGREIGSHVIHLNFIRWVIQREEDESVSHL